MMSDLVPHALGDRPKRLELCDLMEHNPEPIVYTLVISRKIMTDDARALTNLADRLYSIYYN